jgi:arsenate reductase-like glutaredoxin family protein
MPQLFKISSCLLLGLISFSTNSQHLFGNPSCSDWQKQSVGEKTTWLKAYLIPLNLTNVSRKKPKVDAFSQLISLDSVVLYVDQFCAANTDAAAAVGAIRFLDELSATHP